MGFEKTDSGQDNKAKMFAGKREFEHNNDAMTIKLKLNTAAVKTSKMDEQGERTILRESQDRRHPIIARMILVRCTG